MYNMVNFEKGKFAFDMPLSSGTKEVISGSLMV